MGVSRRVGAWHRHGCSCQTQNQGGPCQQPVSWASGSNRSAESLGRDLLLWSCRHLSGLWFYFLQPISQFPEGEDSVSVACPRKLYSRLSQCLRMVSECQDRSAWPETLAHRHGLLAPGHPATQDWALVGQTHQALFSRALS